MLTQVDTLTEAQILQLHALYQQAWWAQTRTPEQVRRMLAQTSLIIGLVDESGQLVAFCRLLTDFIFHATLFDVIVSTDRRGQGIGRQLLDAVHQHPRLRDVKTRWLCCLPEMLPFYRRWGFTEAMDGIVWMKSTRSEGNPAHERELSTGT